MSILRGHYGRRQHEPPPQQISDPCQEAVWGLARTTPHMAFPGETSPIVNGHIDYKENPEAHVYKVHLPGLKRNDVRVEVDDGRVLSIIGERKVEKEMQRGMWHHMELSRGHFVQRFNLPENAMVDHVKAHMDNGVLTITVPKHRVVNRNVRNINISGH